MFYIVSSLLAIAVDHIYAIFGHGVSSQVMTWMFLYPFLGGTLFFLMINWLAPWISNAESYRAFFNIYNSGIAALTVGSFLKGILDIAGTSSQYSTMFFVAGGLFAGAGLIILGLCCTKHFFDRGRSH